MPESNVIQTLQTFRAQMDALDESLMRDLGTSWMRIENQLLGEMAALAEEMARRRAEGEEITIQMVYRSERNKLLQEQIAIEIQKYNESAAKTISTYQERAATLGINSAKFSIMASYPNAYSAAFNRINIDAVEAMIGLAGDGSPLFNLLMKDYGSAVQGLLDALISGIATGKGVKEIVQGMVEGFGLGLDRALLIARTETQRAYRMGSTEQYRQSGVVSGFMRLVKKEGACLGCLLLDGEIFTTADELDDHPNGRCTAVPIVRGVDAPEWEKGPEWLQRQPEAKQREIMGNQRYELWKSGTPLETMTGKTHNEVWGNSPRPTPIEQLVGSSEA
jgi:hypothetical protein